MSGTRHLYLVPSPALVLIPAGLKLRKERFERDHGASITPDGDRWIVWFPYESGSVMYDAAELGDALNKGDEYFASPDPDSG